MVIDSKKFTSSLPLIRLSRRARPKRDPSSNPKIIKNEKRSEWNVEKKYRIFKGGSRNEDICEFKTKKRAKKTDALMKEVKRLAKALRDPIDPKVDALIDELNNETRRIKKEAFALKTVLNEIRIKVDFAQRAMKLANAKFELWS